LNILDCACKNAAIVLNNPHRIQCPVVEYQWMGTIRTRELVNLEKLRIFIYDIPPSIPVPLDMSLLPRLQHLDIWDSDSLNQSFDFSRVRVLQLRFLAVTTDEEGRWCHFIQVNSRTLEILKLNGQLTCLAEQDLVLEVSVLQELIVFDETELNPRNPVLLEIRAPRLTFHQSTSRYDILSLESPSDFGTVVHLRINNILDLRKYQRLQILQVYSSPLMQSVVEQLEGDDSLCPELEFIECRMEEDDIPVSDREIRSIHNTIVARNMRVNSDIGVGCERYVKRGFC